MSVLWSEDRICEPCKSGECGSLRARVAGAVTGCIHACHKMAPSPRIATATCSYCKATVSKNALLNHTARCSKLPRGAA